MDEFSVRNQLEEARSRLKQIDDEREILLSLIKGFEGWLRLHGARPPLTLAVPAPKNAPKGSVSLRSAIRQVLQNNVGRPIHTREILEQAEAMGARTESKSPLSVIDLHLLHLKDSMPLERTGTPRTWILRSRQSMPLAQ